MSEKSPTAAARVAAFLLAAEALTVLGLAGWEIVALIGSDAASVPSSIALIVLTVVGAVGLAAFSVAVFTARSWGRSGGIVAQLLVIAVAIGAATGQYGHPVIAVVIAAPGVVTLISLLLAARSGASPR